MAPPRDPEAQLGFRRQLFRGRRVVVTGRTSGIGAAIAQAFGRLGAEVTAAGLVAGEVVLDDVAEVVELDVTDEAALTDLLGGFDRLGALVNCAGVIYRQQEYVPAVFRRVLEVNLVATLGASVAARDALARDGGSIINIASMMSYFGAPHAPAYGASKAAVVELTKSLALAFAPGVRVNAIAPGWIRTPLTVPVQENPEADRRIVERTALGRWGEVDDLWGAVVFLASPAARFVTGATLPVDGGYSVA
jgi:NAD(P)-dependent dehydrogenase (short-subunit alcohol dehydrogenase family)